MRRPVAVIEPRPGIFGRPSERETQDWTAVVVRHEGDDWPPPAWLALMAGGGTGHREAPDS